MDLLSKVWDQLAGRLEGPLMFRFLMHPIMAGLQAVKAGRADAREKRAPYLWSALVDPGQRPQLLREGITHVRHVFLLAIVLDMAYQLIVSGWIYPLQAVFVAALRAIVPYVLIRGPVTRWQSRR